MPAPKENSPIGLPVVDKDIHEFSVLPSEDSYNGYI